MALLDCTELKQEVLSSICNLPLVVCVGENPLNVLKKINAVELISFLCSSNETHSLFGAVSLGNIMSKDVLRDPIIESGALNPLLNVSSLSKDFETQRCIAYALCNLLTDEKNHDVVIQNGGLTSLSLLCVSSSVADCRTGLATLRALCMSEKFRATVLNAGILQCIISETSTIQTDLECRENVTAFICLLSMSTKCRIHLLRNDAGACLLRFLLDIIKVEVSEDLSLKYVVGTIANLCENDAWHSHIATERPLSVLITHTYSKDLQIRRELMRCFVNLSRNSESHEALIRLDITELLFNLCDENSDGIVSDFVAICIINLAKSSMCRRTAFASIMKLAKHRSDTPYACLGLCSLYAPEVMSSIEIKGFFGDMLGVYIHSKNPECRRYGSFLLGKISDDVHITDILVKEGKLYEIVSGLMQGLFNAINESHFTVLYMLSALRKYTVLEVVQCYVADSATTLQCISRIPSIFETKTDICREASALICNISLAHKNKEIIAKNSKLLQVCLFLCQSQDDETVRFALTAVANVAENITTLQFLIADENKNLLYDIMSLLGRGEVIIYREATRAISNILSIFASHYQFIAQNGLRKLSRLVNILQCTDYECLYSISLSLRKLAARSENHRALFDEKLSIVKMLDRLSAYDDFLDVQLLSMASLVDLSSNAKKFTNFGEEGDGLLIVTCSLTSCFHAKTQMKLLALQILRRLLCCATLKEVNQICTSNVVSSIFECTRENTEIPLLEGCSQIISILLEHSEIQMIAVHDTMFIPTLHKLEEEGSNLCKRNLSKILCCLSCNSQVRDLGKQVFGDEEIRLIFALLSNCDDSQCFKFTTGTICNLLTVESSFIEKFDSSTLMSLLKIIVTRERQFVNMTSNYVCLALHRIIGNDVARSFIKTENALWLIQVLLEYSHSSSFDTSSYAFMSLCNLLLSRSFHLLFMQNNGTERLYKAVKANSQEEGCRYALMAMLNLASSEESKILLSKSGILMILLNVLKSDDFKMKLLAAQLFGNLLSSDREVQHDVLNRTDFLIEASLILDNTDDSNSTHLKRAVLLALYNLSQYAEHHHSICDQVLPKSLIEICESDDVCCRRLSIMMLCNLASNPITRQNVIKGRGLQTAIIMLTDEDIDCQRYACVYLSNVTNHFNTRQQVVVHGALKRLLNMGQNGDLVTQYFALTSIVNVAGHDFSHKFFTQEFIATLSQSNDDRIIEISGILMANLASSRQSIHLFRDKSCLNLLLKLLVSDVALIQCFSLSAMRNLVACPSLHVCLDNHNILSLIKNLKLHNKVENARELSGLICNLTLSNCYNKFDMSTILFKRYVDLIKYEDDEVTRQVLSSLANLSEDVSTHDNFIQPILLSHFSKCLSHDSINVVREAMRCISNIVTTRNTHEYISSSVLQPITFLSNSTDSECLYYVTIALRKMVQNTTTHSIILHNALQSLMTKVATVDDRTRLHILVVLRDIAGNSDLKVKLAKLGPFNYIVPLLRLMCTKVQTLVLSILRHLSLEDSLKSIIIQCNIVGAISRNVPKAPEDFRCQATALLANLSEIAFSQPKLVNEGAVSALVTVHRHENLEIKMVSYCLLLI